MGLLDFFHRKSGSDTELPLPAEQSQHASADVAVDIADSQALELNFDSVELSLPLAQSIQHDYLAHCIQEKTPGIHSALLNEFAHTLIYDDNERVKCTPNMPTILPQLMQCLRDENTPKQSYVDLISQDPLLAASVLRTSRSALYNPSGRPIDNFERAVVILGVSGLKALACTALLGSVVSSSKEPLIQSTLWPYTLHTAVIAQMLSKDSAVGFSLYLSGLFHSIGEMTFLEEVSKNQHLLLNVETYNFLHEQYFERLTLAILRDWELPEDVVDQVRTAAVTPAMEGKIENCIEMSSYLAKLIYLYQKKVWSEETVEEALAECHLTIEQLKHIITLSEQQVSSA